MTHIPLVDLKAQYKSIQSEIDAAIQATLDEGAFIMGEQVRAFEREFAEYCGAPHAVACGSGTAALHLALMVCGVGPGDEVVTVSHTFAGAAEPICHCGATPVFADVCPDTYTLAPEALDEAISGKTKAVIVVHLYGQCAEMEPIQEIAARRGIAVIEDAAQAHGAEYQGRRAGAMGQFGCFSFYPGKNLGAYGDAGMVTASDKEQAQRMALLVDHGRESKYVHKLVGYNYRMDSLQAAILRVKLRHLDRWVEARRARARRYGDLLKGLPLQTPSEIGRPAYHLYVIQCDDRDGLARWLESKDIATGVHYPIPLHLQPCFEHLSGSGQGRMTHTEALSKRVLSLPIYPEMSDEQQDRVVQAVRAFFGG